MNLRYRDLVEMIRAARSCPARLTFIGNDDVTTMVPMARLYAEAADLAAILRDRGVEPTDRVPVLVDDPHGFVRAFFAVLLAGATPCPLAPPGGFTRVDDATARIRSLLTYLRSRHVVVSEGISAEVVAGMPDAAFEVVDASASAGGGAGALDHPPPPAPLAMIQCTSGSTGLPKGVMLSQENLLANMHQIGVAAGMGSDDVGVTWLPLHHDMGLIGCLLAFLYWQADLVMLTPAKFLRRPSAWLRAVSTFRGTLSAAPNFAYEYAAARIPDDELDGIDLSSWRVAVCGSEPVRASTIQRFTQRFRPLGLRSSVIVPCYGLAEGTLMVTAEAVGGPLRLDQRSDLPEPVVSCGTPVAGTRVRIVPAEQGAAQSGEAGRPSIGLVQVAGPAVMQGYFDQPALTAEVLSDGWLDTGDLGYLDGGRLYITGRQKDVIILRGRCYAPASFEWAAEEVAGVRAGSVAALGVASPDTGTDALHVVCETRVTDEATRDQLIAQVKGRIGERTGVLAGAIHLVRVGALPKTTSGKLRRAEIRRWLETALLPGVAPST